MLTYFFNGLWRNGDFVRLWTSLTITHFTPPTTRGTQYGE